LVERARNIIGPEVELSSDFISGFCGETEEDHEKTLSLMHEVKFTECFMFAYSERERTRAYHKYEDNVPETVKLRRLSEVISTFRTGAAELSRKQIGKRYRVLIEKPSKRNPNQMKGRTDGLRRCVVHGSTPELFPPGTYCDVEVFEATMATLHGRLIDECP
jgi:tRNA-2-methylthio-N6-dimethylallyladenosine synthase